MEVNDTKKDKSNKHLFRNILLFIIFLIVGVVVGYFGTTKYLEYRENEQNVDNNNVDNEPVDITEDEQSKELISLLYDSIEGNPMFYSTQGVDVSKMDNNTKLSLIYEYLVNNQHGTSENIDALWYDANTCSYEFQINEITDPYNPSYICSVLRLDKSLFKQISKKLYNDESVEVSSEFIPVDGKKCVTDINNENNYLCGNIAKSSDITGSLESKFTIIKVTKDENGTISIYEKGYLVDKRSNVGDQYDNYYLHSSDSTDYYFELKSADNLTFKHTFKTNDRLNYYYVSSELVK